MAAKPIVLVTGGNTGIGYETVKALLQSPTPSTILMGSRSLDKAKDAIQKVEAEVPGSKSEIVALQIDIENDKSIEEAYKEVESKYGKVDALVNNADEYSFYLFPLPFSRLFSSNPTVYVKVLTNISRCILRLCRPR